MRRAIRMMRKVKRMTQRRMTRVKLMTQGRMTRVRRMMPRMAIKGMKEMILMTQLAHPMVMIGISILIIRTWMLTLMLTWTAPQTLKTRLMPTSQT